MKKYCILAVFFTSLMYTTICTGQLLMEKSRVELDVEPGVTVVNDMYLHNTSDELVNVRIYWQDFEYIEPFDGKKQFLSAGESQFSMSKWVTFSPQEVELYPRSRVKINYVIKIPEYASGGYYGVLFFENQPEAVKFESTGVNLVTRLGSLFFLRTNDKNKASLIKDLTIKDNSLEGKFVNEGNVVLFPKGIYYILDKESFVAERGELDKLYLPPNKDAAFRLELPSLKKGSYTLVLTFDLDDGDSIVREVDFTIDDHSNTRIVEVRE